MFGKLFSIVKYVIIAVFVLILASSLLDSVIMIAASNEQGNYLSFIIITGITTILVRMASKNRKQEIFSLLIQITAGCSVIYLVFIVFTTSTLMMGYSANMPAVTLASVLLTAVYCKIVYEPPDLGRMVGFIISSTRATMNIISMESRGDVSAWASISGNFRILILPEGSASSILELLKERLSLPVTLTHLEGFDYITIPNDPFWQQRIEEIFIRMQLNVTRASPLLELGVQATPLFYQSHALENITYGLSKKDSVIEFLLKDWPNGLTVFPSSEGLRTVVPVHRVPGLELEHLSKTQALRLLIHRDARVFQKGGMQDLSII
jgi:hypothetical protein